MEASELDSQLIFEKSVPGRGTDQLPACDVPELSLDDIAPGLARETPAALPEVSELQAARHFVSLSHNNHSVDTNFYPLGSCTMKYNPKVNEAVVAFDGFSGLHPYVEFFRAQGTMRLLYNLERMLAEISGMDAITLAPMAGAHGEFVGMSMIRAFHIANGEGDTRRVVLTPDSSHGTNPASAAIAGFDVKTIKSNERGEVDIDDLKAHCDETTAGIMLTNPNTLGIFETQILEIAEIVHGVGGQLYYDGANLNAIVGKCRPGDMGFDVVHINLHKTFSTPHGGGGPGAGPVGVAKHLEPFLPRPRIVKNPIESPEVEFIWSDDFPQSIGRVSTFFGNVGVLIRAYAYILSHGAAGLKQNSESAVLAANYIRAKLQDDLPAAFDRMCMHEYVATPGDLCEKGIHTLDIAKRLIDYGIHPMTIYFPLIVPEAMMIEPTETEPLDVLDHFIEVMKKIAQEAVDDPDLLHRAPLTTSVGRLDETAAARKPIVAYKDV